MSLEGDKVMVIYFVRSDLKMSKGQIAGKVADVTQFVIEECIQRKYITYITWKKFHSSQKIVLKVNSHKEFDDLHSKLVDLSRELRFPIKIVKDDQKIKTIESTPTVLAFGPVRRNSVEHIVSDLKLL
ncbi:MAG TPA: aminoacyl-tRNA hydrolase [Candidatus Nitrosocosmicus sp.]|nr:aminoacyl-tRNA hydrolase [Candidatus Nitrosocosmicus sp.]